MNSILKKLIFVVLFVLATLVLPAVILLMFVDASANFSIYVIAYGVIVFAILGYVVASVRSMEKQLGDALEEIKMQNAAIAYKLSNTDTELQNIAPAISPEVKADEPVKTDNIPLNPAEPLVVPTAKRATEKIADDGFDDFK